jgi:ankyrin repeat protein
MYKSLIKLFEKNIGFLLPEEYKVFVNSNLLETIEGKRFKTKNSKIQSTIHTIFFFNGMPNNPDNIIELYFNLQDRFRNHQLPIFSDDQGNYIFIELLTKNYGKIYFFEHDTNKKYLVSSNFQEFIDNLNDNVIDYDDFDLAIQKEDIVFFEKIMKGGKEVDEIFDDYGRRVIVTAAIWGKLNLVKYFLSLGADIKGVLVEVIWNGHIDVIEFLISKGANVNDCEEDNNEATPLIIAAQRGNLNLVKLFLRNGANLKAVDKYGNGALDKAQWSGNSELIAYLEEVMK